MSDADRFFEMLYTELRRIARNRLAAKPHQSLQPTELVNAAYFRLQDHDWDSKSQFRRAAARAIRLALIDHIRSKMADKRGGNAHKVAITVTLPDRQSPVDAEQLLALSEAIERMQADHPEHAEVVVLRYFAGMTIKEVADAMGYSRAKVERQWRFARAWLLNALNKDEPPSR
jgi:RNA polymerase sigma factor (TIGR02999 family)